MNSSNDVNITNPSSSSYSNVREDDYSKESNNNYSISKSNVPSYTKILVPHDGKEMSDKALSHAVYLSNLSGAEIVILRIIEDVDKLGDTSVNVSQNNKAIDNQKGFEHNIQGELVNAMEQKIKKCVEAGSKNKISFEIKAGHVVDEIVKAGEEDNYDLIVMTTSHLDSWGLNDEENSKVEVQKIEHKIELQIVNLAAFCFKRGLLIEEFVDVLENMSSLEHKTKIPIEQLPNQLLQKQRHLESIDKKIQEIKLKEQLLLNDYNITADSLKGYSTNRTSF